MSVPDYLISTPENVDLHLEFAGIGNRILACFFDTLLICIAIIAIFALTLLGNYLISLMPLLQSFARALLLVIMGILATISTFLVYFGYFIFFEGIWQGQTPGKKLVGIRVVEQNGAPVSWTAVLIRNLIRTFDEGFVLIGILPMVFDKHERRFGDMAANTLVIRERLYSLSDKDMHLTSTLASEDIYDTGHLKPEDYDLLLNFLTRRWHMSKKYRPQVALQLKEYFAGKLNNSLITIQPEEFLEKVLLSYRERADI